jgi:hypothetical protein
MVVVQECLLVVRQHINIHQLPTMRRHSHSLEPQEWFIAKLVLDLNFLDHHHVLNSYAKGAIFIEARLIAKDISYRKRHLTVLHSRSNANRPLMNVQVGSHAVAGAMSIVQAERPEVLSSQRVQSKSGRAFGELAAFKSDVAFKHERIRFFFFCARLAEVQRARCVGGSVKVLSTGVTEVDGFGVDGGTGAFHRLVVDDGSIGAGGGDSVKGETNEEIMFTIWWSEQVLPRVSRFVPSDFFQFIGRCDLIEFYTLGDELIL